MRCLIQNHTAGEFRNGHSFSIPFLKQNWSGLYHYPLQLITPGMPILFLDPFGKWPDNTQGDQPATLFDQWQRCHESRNSDETHHVADINQFSVLARLYNPMIFKIGYIPQNVTPLLVYQSLYPFVRMNSIRNKELPKPRICIDALAAQETDPDLRSMVVREVRALGFNVVAEGWVHKPIVGIEQTLLGWREVCVNGGISNLPDCHARAIVMYAPEDIEQPMTMSDVKRLEIMGHSVAFTPDVLPESEGAREE